MSEHELRRLLHEAAPSSGGDRLHPDRVLLAAQHRHHIRRAATLTLAAVSVVIAVVPVGLLVSGRDTGTTAGPAVAVQVSTSDAGLPAAELAPPGPLRVLPPTAIAQLSRGSRFGGLRPQPEVPQIAWRLYSDGSVLATNVADAPRWTLTKPSDDRLDRALDLVERAGLGAGQRDYGALEEATGTLTVQVAGQAGAATSQIPIRPAALEALPLGLTSVQEAARRAVAELDALMLDAAAADGRPYPAPEWSRYAQPAPNVSKLDRDAYRSWTGDSALTDGTARNGSWCIRVSQAQFEAGPDSQTSSYRVDETAWYVRYDEVLPGEEPCKAVAPARPSATDPAPAPAPLRPVERAPSIWWLAAQPQPKDRRLSLLVHELACASGTYADDRIRPTVRYSADTITVRINMLEPGGFQQCPGNPYTAYQLELDQPVGDRKVINGDLGGSRPAATSRPDGL